MNVPACVPAPDYLIEKIRARARTRARSRLLVSFLCCFLLTGCGYHLGRGSCVEGRMTFCVPYVEGDKYGHLTTALIRAVTQKGGLVYESGHPDLILRVCLQEPIDEMIGYIFAVEDDQPQDFLLSNEARLTITAVVTLVDGQTQCRLLGPFEVTAFLEYDFDPDLTNVNDHALSLGQLEMHNEAQDAAFPPLYTLLAEKIADYLYNGW